MTPQPLEAPQREKLRRISAQLLALHKLLLDRERARYEQGNGPIASPGEFLNLVLTHEQFEWLRQLSGLIVQIDELVAPRGKSHFEDAASALHQIREILTPDEHGTAFQQKYWAAIHESPDVLVAHRELKDLL